MKNDIKTNVMRVLDSKKVKYSSHTYEPDATLRGEEIAAILGEDVEKVFKTLVTVSKSGKNYVFVVPVNAELDLKKAASAAGEKAISMIKQKDLLPLTGYVHGGCSPIGMKKEFPVFIQEQASQYETIYFSGGQIGTQIEMDPKDCISFLHFQMADLIQ